MCADVVERTNVVHRANIPRYQIPQFEYSGTSCPDTERDPYRWQEKDTYEYAGEC